MIAPYRLNDGALAWQTLSLYRQIKNFPMSLVINVLVSCESNIDCYIILY